MLKYELIISGLLTLLPFVASFFIFDKLYIPTLEFAGLNGLFIGVAVLHASRTQSSKVLGGYFLIYMLVYSWINFEPHEGITSIITLTAERIDYSIRTLTILFLIVFSIYLMFTKQTLKSIIKIKSFRVALVLLGVYLITEMPIYGYHGDFGGHGHGHSYWYGIHMH